MRPLRVLALACLVVILVSEGSGFLRVAWRARFNSLLDASRRAAPERPTRDSSLSFDPDYGPFLEAVRGATPPDSTIALFVPETLPLYTYQASYVLAPRILVGPVCLSEANYAAVYTSRAAPGAPIALPVRKGSLSRLR